MIEPATFNMPGIACEQEGSVRQRDFSPPPHGRFLRRTATPSRDFLGRTSPLSTPRVFSPARVEPVAACCSNLGHLRDTHCPGQLKKFVSSWKIFTWLNEAVYFPNKTELCLNTQLGFTTPAATVALL